jgi:plasmid stabilization system protein ParE
VTTVIWSPQAIRDVEAVRSFIAQDSPMYADLVARRLVAAVERLQFFPESGRIVPERQDSEIREVIVTPYRIVYRLRRGAVEVVTVFRGSREFPDSIL